MSCESVRCVFFFNDTATTEIYTLSLHDALPIFIEPGLIVTEFGETAAGSLAEVEEHGAYAKFNSDVAYVTANAYKGPMARFGAGPEAVAAKISKALSANRPNTRYKVTPSAKVMMGMRRLMTDRM